jgi:arylsulfatase A-like enzyme
MSTASGPRTRLRAFEPRAVALALAILASACASPPPPEARMRHIDLLPLIAEQVVEEGSPLAPESVEIVADVRSVLFQHPPSRVALTKLPDNANCWFRFAPNLSPKIWGQSDGVVFRASRRAPGGAVGSERAFYTERFLGNGKPADAPAEQPAGWVERNVRIPGQGGTLILETREGDAGNVDFDWASWASPFLLCELGEHARAVPPTPHIVLISIDTLRPDHLGAYGYQRPTSPYLDALARQSVVFTRAFSTANWTLPAHATMFTGLPPHLHGAGHGAISDPLGEGPRTLAELLNEAGYRTVAFTAGGIMSRREGLARGFEIWHEATRENLRAVMPRVLAAVDRDDSRPLFLFLHTYDVHGPYADYPHDVGFEPDASDPRVSDDEWQRIRAMTYHTYQRFDRFRGLEEVITAYDAGIRHVDAQLERLFSHLRTTGMDPHALVIVTSDHGESFYEDALYIGHSFSLRDDEVRIPLIVRVPGSTGGTQSDELVSLEDLMPLVLDAARLTAPAGVTGTSPLARLRGQRERREVVFGESSHTGDRFARNREGKVILSAGPAMAFRPGGVELSLRDRFRAVSQSYDLVTDPREQVNRWIDSRADLGGLPLVKALEKVPAPSLGSPAPRTQAPEEIEALRALGYTH